ncbi:DUF4013 domain-containing protein [Methanococcus aeolicus]|uniref:DUF4013 domain-containing protein n=1 Tax=Methanococcus aeolicus TaxID=42879 RepID=UPI0021C978F9|nr:DUF4013 domain-containing protein [Methanococcus aeolicus]UXM84170.1 DUF4013 domain-containing protein [Methanococcus aeolicus]
MMEHIWKSFMYMFDDKNWKKKLAIGGVIGIIPILNISLYGYMADIINLIYGGIDNELPEFNIYDQFIGGFKLSVVLFAYFILFYLLFIVIIGVFSVIFGDNIIIDIISILCIAIFMLFTQIAFPHYVYTNKTSSFFEFNTLFKILKKTWVDILIFDVILCVIIGLLFIVIYIIAILLSLTVILIPVAIWLFGILYYYIYVVSGYFYGKIYLNGIDKEPVNMGHKNKLLPTKTIKTTSNKDLNLLNTYLLKARELPPKALNDFQNNNENEAIEKWSKSLEYYKKAEKIAKSNKDEELIQSINNNIKLIVQNILDAKIKSLYDKIEGMV